MLFFLAPATTEIYTLSLHDALPISTEAASRRSPLSVRRRKKTRPSVGDGSRMSRLASSARCTSSVTVLCVSERRSTRSEEHTSELQSHHDLVCRLLLEKKK